MSNIEYFIIGNFILKKKNSVEERLQDLVFSGVLPEFSLISLAASGNDS